MLGTAGIARSRFLPALAEAGKAVLCEEPLSVDADQARRVLAVAGRAPLPLREAFVFPFTDQHRRLTELLAEGATGGAAWPALSSRPGGGLRAVPGSGAVAARRAAHQEEDR